MIVAIVPAYNEEYRLGRVLSQLLSIKLINHIFVILNGSNKLTQKEAEIAQQKQPQSITLVSFSVPLGIDVPRAVGANLAYTSGADYILFVDGDMVGEYTAEVTELLETATQAMLDLALFDCYPHHTELTEFQEPLFYYRHLVNQQLALAEQIRLGTPSHGPHLVSRRLLNIVPWEDYAVPPTLLVHAVRHQLKVDLAGSIPHAQLGSSIKNEVHNKLVTDTIIGDCLEALCMINHQPRSRYHAGKLYLGYHEQRRFDLLAQFLAGRTM
ncbi:MAG TPA: glycosyltransferase [Oscillospiraceae bacterium]|nr:glycosyltransferase [Oscillospiraceae bacterium]